MAFDSGTSGSTLASGRGHSGALSVSETAKCGSEQAILCKAGFFGAGLGGPGPPPPSPPMSEVRNHAVLSEGELQVDSLFFSTPRLLRPLSLSLLRRFCADCDAEVSLLGAWL